MKLFYLLPAIGLLFLLLINYAQAHSGPTESDREWSVKTTDSVMQRKGLLSISWNYEFGLMLKAIEQVWRKTGEQKYFEYIQKNLDSLVDQDGNIRTYTMEEFNLDQINAGKMLIFMYNQTGAEKYLKAARLLREQLKLHPRTKEGGFWHKKVYPHQMWLDGLYMAAPFYAEYAMTFNEPEAFDDVVAQIILLEQHTKDLESGLLYHGWDESKSQTWAHPETGCSLNFWGRAMGWYMMAIVDVLDYLPEDHPRRKQIIKIFNEVAGALAKVQDESTGLWYQVLDKKDFPGNYYEASASSMFVYAFAKGARRGYLGQEYLSRAQKGYQGIITNLVSFDDKGLVNLNRICKVAGLGSNHPNQPYRDGSLFYYLSELIVSNDYKGVGPFILASVEIESNR